MDWQDRPDDHQQEPQFPAPPFAPSAGQPGQGGGTPPLNSPTAPPVYPQPGGMPPQNNWQPPAQGQNPSGYPYGRPVPPSNGYPPASNPYAPYPQGNWTNVPYYPQQVNSWTPYGQSPGYGGYGNPYIPPQQPADPSKPFLVMGTRRLTKEQYRRLNNANRGVLTGLQVVLGLLILIFSAAAIINGVNNGDVSALIVCASLTAVSLVVMAVSLMLRSRKRGKNIDKAYACAKESGDGASIVEVYIDRVESISSRGRSVVWYAGATLVEYADMLVLMGPGAAIVWRAEDMVPSQMQMIQSVIYPQLRPGARQSRGMFYPRAYAPLPVPEITNHDEVCLTFHTEAEKPLGYPSLGRHFAQTLPLILPLMTIISVYMANSVAITPSILIDLALFLMIFWVGGLVVDLLLVALLHSITSKKAAAHPADYAITRDGLARQWGGGTLFIPASHVVPAVKSDGVQLDTPYGRLMISWEDIPDREAFTDRLQHFGPHKAGNP